MIPKGKWMAGTPNVIYLHYCTVFFLKVFTFTFCKIKYIFKCLWNIKETRFYFDVRVWWCAIYAMEANFMRKKKWSLQSVNIIFPNMKVPHWFEEFWISDPPKLDLVSFLKTSNFKSFFINELHSSKQNFDYD